MKKETFDKRAKRSGLHKSSIAYRELLSLLDGTKTESRPDVSNRHRVDVYTDDMLHHASRMGIGIQRGNDAPRGGIAGNYVYLTAKGKRQRF